MPHFGGGASSGDAEFLVEAGDFLLKFDDEALEVDPLKEFYNNREMGKDGSNDHGSNTYYYVAKVDGWASDTEMNTTTMDDPSLHYYKNYSDIDSDAGEVCVGILWSYRCDHSKENHKEPSNIGYTSKAYFKVKNKTDLIGNVYQIVSESRLWRRPDIGSGNYGDVRNVPNRYEIQKESKTAITPTSKLESVKYLYVKKKYNADGTSSGHTGNSVGWEQGDSLYIAGYISKIEKEILQRDSSGVKPKDVFDLNAGQRFVDMGITTRMISKVSWGDLTDVTITDYLPVELEYKPGTARLKATYTKGDGGAEGIISGGTQIEPEDGGEITKDGKTYKVLIWTIKNAAVEEDGPSIMYKAEIKGALKNGTNISSFATIQTKEDKRAISSYNGNIDDAGFGILVTNQLSVTKSSEKTYYELHESLKYTITWSNNTNAAEEEKVMYDIMPINGFDGTSYEGSYKINSIEITSPLSFEAYYTTESFVGVDKNKFDKAEIKAGSSNGLGWKKANVNGKRVTFPDSETDPITGWAILTNIPAGNFVSGTVIIDTKDCEPGDIFKNEARIGADGQGTGSEAEGILIDRELSGLAWIDKDRNGIQDEGEEKLPGVTVRLVDSDGNVVKNVRGEVCETVTNASGKYKFEHVPEGNFSVVFADNSNRKVSDLRLTAANQGTGPGADTLDSDAEKKDGKYIITDINMPSGAEMKKNNKLFYSSSYHDAGFCLHREVSGTAWADSNRDGKRDSNEEILPGIKVTLVDETGKTVLDMSGKECVTRTDSSGKYIFEDVPPGDYKIVFSKDTVDPHKYNLTKTHADNVDKTVDNDAVKENNVIFIDKIHLDDDTAMAKKNILTIKHENNDIGLYASRELSGTAWLDSNKDGIRQDDEKLLADVKVTLYDSDGNVVINLSGNRCETMTDKKGFYRFTDLPAGKYRVVFSDGKTKISHYELTKKNQGDDDTKDSDADVINSIICIIDIELPSDAEIITKGLDNPYKSLYHDAGFHDKSSSSTTTTTDKDNTKTSKKGSPKTGDDFRALLWLLMTLASATGLIVTIAVGAKSKKR